MNVNISVFIVCAEVIIHTIKVYMTIRLSILMVQLLQHF